MLHAIYALVMAPTTHATVVYLDGIAAGKCEIVLVFENCSQGVLSAWSPTIRP